MNSSVLAQVLLCSLLQVPSHLGNNAFHPDFPDGAMVCLPMQGTQFRSLVWEDSTYREATKPLRHNY